MERYHVNGNEQRGSHTSAIEAARDILKQFFKVGIKVSPGVIEGNIKARTRSIKLRKLNAETFEMVMVAKGSKQTFKVYGSDQEAVIRIVNAQQSEGWLVSPIADFSTDPE